MTAKITQTISPRPRTYYGFDLQPNLAWQRGSVNSATMGLLLGLIIILCVASLSFFYLGQVLDTAVQGSDVQAWQERITALKEKQRAVELEGAKLRSIESIEQRVDELNLVATGHVSFLADQPDQVAVLMR